MKEFSIAQEFLQTNSQADYLNALNYVTKALEQLKEPTSNGHKLAAIDEQSIEKVIANLEKLVSNTDASAHLKEYIIYELETLNQNFRNTVIIDNK